MPRKSSKSSASHGKSYRQQLTECPTLTSNQTDNIEPDRYHPSSSQMVDHWIDRETRYREGHLPDSVEYYEKDDEEKPSQTLNGSPEYPK